MIDNEREVYRKAGQEYAKRMDAFNLRAKALPLAVAAVGPCPGMAATDIAVKIEAVADRLVAFMRGPEGEE